MVANAQPLLLLHEDLVFRARVRKSLPGVLRLVEVPDWTELRRAALTAAPGAVALIDPYAGQPATSPAPELVRLRSDFPVFPVFVALSGHGTRRSGPLDANAPWMSGLGWVSTGVSGDALRQRLVSLRAGYFRRLLDLILPPGLSASQRALLQDAVEIAAGGGLAEDWAEVLGTSVRTLLRRCTRAGLPPPRRLLAWMRVLLAVDLLESPGHSISTAAVACGYSADLPLRRAISILTGMSPMLLLREGGVRGAAQHFALDLAAYRNPRGM